MNRRLFASLALTALGAGSARETFGHHANVDSAIDLAHDVIWGRFIDQHGVMLDFTDLDGTISLPTPDECRAGKPNALGWFQPIENGAMFNGMYLDAAIQRWERTKRPSDAEKAKRLMEGLLKLNSISEVKGFVGRGLSTDGLSHFPMGSNDQTSPWFYGLYRYWQSTCISQDEKKRIEKQVTETAEVILSVGWRMPAEAPFMFRGSFASHSFNGLSRRLFVLKWMHCITGDNKWHSLYLNEINVAKPTNDDPSRVSALTILRRGMVYEYAKTHNWTSACEVACLRGLWELETDSKLKEAYGEGLDASARLAAESLPLADQFDNDHPSTFSVDWRSAMMPLWKPQSTEQEAEALAKEQLRAYLKVAPRRQQETAFVREPTSAAWIVTLAANSTLVAKHREAIERVAKRFDYRRLYYSTFFWIEAAWWRLS